MSNIIHYAVLNKTDPRPAIESKRLQEQEKKRREEETKAGAEARDSLSAAMERRRRWGKVYEHRGEGKAVREKV